MKTDKKNSSGLDYSPPSRRWKGFHLRPLHSLSWRLNIFEGPNYRIFSGISLCTADLKRKYFPAKTKKNSKRNTFFFVRMKKKIQHLILRGPAAYGFPFFFFRWGFKTRHRDKLQPFYFFLNLSWITKYKFD